MKHSINSQKKTRWTLRLVALTALALAWLAPATAQTDYTGTYYIASKDYTAANTSTNYYLCPTEGWAFYVADDATGVNSVTGTDNGKPFLTTYQCRNGVYDATKAVWNIEKAPAPNDAYYYIIQVKTGRYMVSNGAICGNPDRARVHLEAIADPNDLDERALFDIYLYSGHLVIRPLGITDGTSSNHTNHDTHKWLTVNKGNQPHLYGTNHKTDGPTGFINTGGIICIYTEDDANAWFYLETALSIDPPVITNNHTASNTFTITAATGATIYYTTDGSTPTTSSPNSGSSPINISQTEGMRVIKAIAKHPSDNAPTAVITYTLPVCGRPSITVDNSNQVTITAEAGADIHYTTDNNVATASSPLYTGSFDLGSATIIRAIATKAGYYKSAETVYAPPLTVHSSSEMTDMNRYYLLASDFSSTAAIGTTSEPFRGSIDGQMNTFTGLDHPLVAYADGATIKNVILDNVTLSGGTNVGAICNEAAGDCRIYNCGVLASNSTVAKDADGYDYISSCSSILSGSGCVGGIVGKLDGSSRVINCFSYANINGGTHRGGIVGKNNVAYNATDYQTMVMNCMFYGEIATTGSPTQIAPIYGGEMITNDGDNDGVNNFNYFRIEANYIKNTAITKTYNCALGAETRFLQRFEFFRHLLNSNRELAAWWATDDVENKDEMMKWVMEPSQIGTSTPYPILKTPGKYPSVVNYTPSTTAYDEEHRNQGRKLTNEGDGGVLHVTISMGSGGDCFDAPSGAAFKTGETGRFDLTITDKDFEHFNFNYGKVQLPYYNDYCVGNYTGNRVVTGWKIVSITGGTAGNYSTGDDVTYTEGELTATPYNFADRKCKNKDLYSQSGRVFNQGAYWDVPEGVTAITIEPYWGKAVYLADAYWDVTYKNSGTDAMAFTSPVSTVGGGQHYENRVSDFNGQIVYTSLGGTNNAISSTGLYAGTDATTYGARSVYDYAVVLVGNYHNYNNSNDIAAVGKPYTVTSVDLDGDNEPDYSFILRFNGRTGFHPVRYDFLNLIGLGMAQKTTGGTGSYNLGIMQPKFWFEVTNTALFRVTQFEYSPADRAKKPIILQGGVVEQWVTQQQDAGDAVEYFHVGGNVWFKEFHRGSHQDNAEKSTPHPPVSVTGGDFDVFYLTGLYQSQAAIYNDNAECYINGGRFGEMASAGMEGIGTSDDKGNITWVIDNADIKEFYGGGINSANPVHGNIHTIISNSHVDIFCGGPKFGDMVSGRTVKTVATDCTFGTYFGAGYGGNAYNRYAPKNQTEKINIDWNKWVREQYKKEYSDTYQGVSTRIDYQFIPMSGNTNNVCRLFVDYISFSLAQCHNVTSTLTGCTVTGNFYGGGSLGKVDGDVSSTLDGCTVKGNVFGAGYSASLPTVEVDSIGFRTEPFYYVDLGTYRTAVKGQTTTYSWEQRATAGVNNTNKILYTTEDLTTLGTVDGNILLTIKGDSTVEGSIFGGGEESAVTGDTEVIIKDRTVFLGNVYGGGNMGEVGGNAKVIINGAH